MTAIAGMVQPLAPWDVMYLDSFTAPKRLLGTVAIAQSPSETSCDRRESL
jgi:hypothetical protein